MPKEDRADDPPSSFSPVVPDIDPRLILDMNYAFARTAMLVAAVCLHIFTLLSDRELTCAALAVIAKTEPGPTERLPNQATGAEEFFRKGM